MFISSSLKQAMQLIVSLVTIILHFDLIQAQVEPGSDYGSGTFSGSGVPCGQINVVLPAPSMFSCTEESLLLQLGSREQEEPQGLVSDTLHQVMQLFKRFFVSITL